MCPDDKTFFIVAGGFHPSSVPQSLTAKAMMQRLARAVGSAFPMRNAESSMDLTKTEEKHPRVLVLFNTIFLYGMERAVIDLFVGLHLHLRTEFLVSQTIRRKNLPVWKEIKRAGFAYSFLSDKKEWPQIGRPRSIGHAYHLFVAMVVGNWNVLARAVRNDALYAPGLSYFWFCLIAAIWLRVARKQVIYHFHDLRPRPRAFLRIASIFITDWVHNTTKSRAIVQLHYPFIKAGRHHVVPCLIEIPDHNDDLAVVEQLSNRRNLLFVGQVALHKGIDLLIAAFKMLLPKYPGIALHVVGSGSDSALGERLIALCNELPILLWGYRSDRFTFFRHSFVYIHPSPPSRFQESFGRGVVEAMSTAVPCVCFRSGALEEIVVDGETGLICNEETPECLASNIGRFLANPQLRNQCGANAKRRYLSYYAEEQITSAWLNGIFNISADRGYV